MIIINIIIIISDPRERSIHTTPTLTSCSRVFVLYINKQEPVSTERRRRQGASSGTALCRHGNKKMISILFPLSLYTRDKNNHERRDERGRIY